MKNVNSMLPQDPAETDTGTAQFPLSSPEKHSGGSQSGAKLVEDKRHLKRIKEGAHSLIKLELHYSWDWRDDLAVENSVSEFSCSVPNIHVRRLAPGCNASFKGSDLLFWPAQVQYSIQNSWVSVSERQKSESEE